ncbi:hypothetical protein HHK36_026492 [Tetracentron sinense]|uniref:Uncharacterized protein n=1 Tax=Tetracentron sinense TaxID=13715 RepID=A0A834YLH7_TETSI|nr:hypothetical protein HHK36_026492 [Tetracentron sinense]
MFSHAIDAIASNDLDFYYLVLMWPGAYCTQTTSGSCAPVTGEPKLDFFVRGLLPYTDNGTALTQCNKSSFNLSDLEEDLYSYWSNIRCPSTKSSYLWKSAWTIYGVCSGLTELDYFQKSLDLLQNIDMLSILKKHDISPSDGYYNLTEIKEGIKTEIGVTAAIRCSKNKSDEFQIYEIYLCVDTDATTIIPCPVLPSFTCSSSVVFSSFTYGMFNNAISMDANPIRMSVPE